MEELKKRTDAELYERRGALAAEAETPDADLDAIETEMKAINAELEQRRAVKQAEEDALRAAEEDRRAEEAKRAEMRKLVAEGAGEPINIFTEERKNKNMDLKEIRSSKEYMNAWAEGIKTGRYDECRRLLTENAGVPAPGDGLVPVPTYVEDRIQGIFESNDLLRRVRRTFFRGNLKVGFEVSSTGATDHVEGDDGIEDEALIIGTVEIVANMIKKTILISDELIDMKGQEFLDYVFDEFENKIESYLANAIVSVIDNAPAASTSSAVGVPVVDVAALTLDIVAQAMAQLTNTVTDPVIVMNRGTYAAFRAEQLSANYAVDPFEGLPIVYSSALPSVADADAGETWLIVGDLSAITCNFPAGDQVKFIYDPYTDAPADLVRITGRLYVGVGLTTPGKLAKVALEE